MATRNHSAARAGSRHAIHNLSYPDAANRVAGTNETNSIVVTADNLYQIALQLDDNSLWMLTDDSPITWLSVNSALETDDLNDAYDNFGAVAAVVAIDGAEGQGDLRLNPSGARSLVVDVSSCTGTVDGFSVQDGADGFFLFHQGVDTLVLTADLESYSVQANAAISIVAGSTLTLTGPSGVSIDGAVAIDDNIELTFGGTITTSSNGLLRIAAHGTGYNVIGASATTGHSLNSGDDLLVAGDLEVDGTAYLDGALTVASDITLTAGGTITSDSNGLLRIAAHGTGYNVVGASATTGHSLNSGDDLLVAGDLEVDGTAYLDGALTIASDITMTSGGTVTSDSNGLLRIAAHGTGYNVVGASATTSHSFSSGNDLLVANDLEVDGVGYFDTDVQVLGDLYIMNNGGVSTATNFDLNLSADGTGIVNVGGGTSSHGLSGGTDLLVSGYFEVTESSWFDGPIYFGAQGSIRDNQTQTNDAFQITVGTNSNSLILCQTADAGYDFAHSAETDPTLIIHSANQETDEYVKWTHNQTDQFKELGLGSEIVHHKGLYVLPDEGSFQLSPNAWTGIQETAGFGSIMMADETGLNMECANFCWDEGASVTLLSNTTNVTNADTDGYMCLYASGGKLYAKNRLGGARRVIFRINYTDGFNSPT